MKLRFKALIKTRRTVYRKNFYDIPIKNGGRLNLLDFLIFNVIPTMSDIHSVGDLEELNDQFLNKFWFLLDD